MPNITDVINGIGSVKYYATLDLVKVYYQMPVVNQQLFQLQENIGNLKDFPLDLKTSSAFQRKIQAVLSKF